MSCISDPCGVLLWFQYCQHKSPQMTDNEYKAVAVYRMLKNESSVTQTVTPGHRPVTSTLPVSASVVIHRDGAKVYQTQASSARSLSP